MAGARRRVGHHYLIRWATYESLSLHVAGLTDCPATDFEQVPGAAQAALRVSRVVSDIARGVGLGGELCCLICVEVAYWSQAAVNTTR